VSKAVAQRVRRIGLERACSASTGIAGDVALHGKLALLDLHSVMLANTHDAAESVRAATSCTHSPRPTGS